MVCQRKLGSYSKGVKMENILYTRKYKVDVLYFYSLLDIIRLFQQIQQ